MLVLAGIVTLLFGLNLLSRNLQELAHTRLSRWMDRLSRHPWLCVLVAAAGAFLVQSSSAVVLVIIGLTGGGMIQLSTAFVMLLGANIGTALRVPVLFPIAFAATIVAGMAGLFVWNLSPRRESRNLALVALGLSFVFIGIHLLQSGLAPFAEGNGPLSFAYDGKNAIVLLLQGVGITTVIQSSRLSLSMMADAIAAGTVTVTAALWFMLGANIGSTSTGLLTTLGMSVDCRRVAMLHLFQNVVGVLLAAMALPWLIGLEWVQQTAQRPEVFLWWAHLLFNLACLGFLPVREAFLRVVRFLVPDTVQKEASEKIRFVPETVDPLVRLTHVSHALSRSLWATARLCTEAITRRDPTNLARIRDLLDHMRGEMMQSSAWLRALFLQDENREQTEAAVRLGQVRQLLIECERLYELASAMAEVKKTDPVIAHAQVQAYRHALEVLYLAMRSELAESRDRAVAEEHHEAWEEWYGILMRSCREEAGKEEADWRRAILHMECAAQMERIEELAIGILRSEDYVLDM